MLYLHTWRSNQENRHLTLAIKFFKRRQTEKKSDGSPVEIT